MFAGALAPCSGGCDVQEGLKLPGLGATLDEVGGQVGGSDICCRSCGKLIKVNRKSKLTNFLILVLSPVEHNTFVH